MQQLQMEDSVTHKIRNTWRTLYRFLTLTLIIISILFSIAIVSKLYDNDTAAQMEHISKMLNKFKEDQTAASKSLISLANQITYDVSVLTPIRQGTMETSIIGKVRDYCEINTVPKGTESSAISCNGVSPLHGNEYLDGLNKFFLQPDYYSPLTFGPLIDYPNFIPTATTPHGCTRLPSFSLGTKHWCYTHNIILKDCLDDSISNQYVSMGSLQTLKNSAPFFKVHRSVYLSDGRNRKSCSITSIPLGCLLYCVILTQSEVQNYKSDQAEKQLLTLIMHNGTLLEKEIRPDTLNRDWAMLVPGVGSGVVYYDRVIFPAYGGVKQGSILYEQQKNRYLLASIPGSKCPSDKNKNIAEAKSSYILHYFADRLVQTTFLVCLLDNLMKSDCELITPSNDHVFMGAEGRLYTINNKLYYYQRGSSWWPYPAFFEIELIVNKTATFLTNMTFKQINTIARTGNEPCTGDNTCPKECITGVYQDIWPLNIPSNSKTDKRQSIFTGMFLNDKSIRRNPTFYISSNKALMVQDPFGKSNLKAAYSSTTCFTQTSLNKLYCLYIAEIGDATIGEFQVIPFLREIFVTGRINSAD
ncbi:attachment glycoprotein [Wufeng Rhinolophus sinicus rubulavirus 1]|uniref:Attachment glycoprotein n=1 Tax=Wufeng Rhinolophus sinicus rubulavirus 1 TaxID=2877512 RepID=A0AAE8XQW9_9MONO|nr:attachment glycoprotein [Wufeng Rhinolophus sinicus rubulavirus 1]